MLGTVLVLGCFDVAEATEIIDRVNVEIAESRCYCSDGDVAYVCESNSKKSINPEIDFRKYGYPNATLTSKQLVYEEVLRNARDEYTLHGLPFHPSEFWKKKSMPEQLLYLKDEILELKLPDIAPAFHQNIGYTDNKTFIGCGKASYPKKLEEKFEEAVWKRLQKQEEYKISFDDFTASLRSALEPTDRLYTAPLLMHFTNYLVPKYEFHYKTAEDRLENIPYKTLKFPSEFELANGTKDEGVVVYEREK